MVLGFVITNFGLGAVLAEEVVDKVEVLVGHIDTVLVEQLVHLDEVHPSAGDETSDVGQRRGRRRA